ncbi:MAG: hypothetical protein U0350_45540 [Caldilineaceae bacterium]
MKRLFWSLVSLLVMAVWLFFSYAPAWRLTLPQVTIQGSWSAGLLQPFAVICFALLVIVQLVLLWSTKRILHQQAALPSREAGDKFKLNPMLELFWTVVPLLLVVGLAFASYQTWQHLSSP